MRSLRHRAVLAIGVSLVLGTAAAAAAYSFGGSDDDTDSLSDEQNLERRAANLGSDVDSIRDDGDVPRVIATLEPEHVDLVIHGEDDNEDGE